MEKYSVNSLMREMFASVGNALANNKAEAIQEWRPAMDEMLEETKKYKTVYIKYGQNV